MTSKEFKAANRAWKAERGLEQMRREQEQKALREARYQQNLALKAHGYSWMRTPVDREDERAVYDGAEWTLFDATGQVVTVAEALRRIASQEN